MDSVVTALTRVKRDLGAVEKGKTMEAGAVRYRYRAIDDVLNALHKPLCDHGVVLVPEVVEHAQELAGTSRGGASQFRTTITMRYSVYGPQMDCIQAVTRGEAIDTGDKGTNKAFTAAFKVLLQQLFAIPFATDDPDDEHVEVAGGAPKARKARPRVPASPERSPESSLRASDELPVPTTGAAPAGRSGSPGGVRAKSSGSAQVMATRQYLQRATKSLTDAQAETLAVRIADEDLPGYDEPDLTAEQAAQWVRLIEAVKRGSD